MANDIVLRNLGPDDYPSIISVLDAWWGGRAMADHLPKLFFNHFRDTSFIAEIDGNRAGFLAGFVSQSDPTIAYVHFIGVDPSIRGRGIGRHLYGAFFDAARARGCHEVHAVTHPVNQRSVAFHKSIGFDVLPGDAETAGVPFTRNYDGPGGDRVRFVYTL